MLILGVDPSSTSTGWALLAPKDGEYKLAAHGSYSPNKMAEKRLDADKYLIAGDEIVNVLKRLGCNDKIVMSGTEYSAYVAPSKRSMEVLVSVCMTIRYSLWAFTGIKPVIVHPPSWQSLIGAKKGKSKEASRRLAKRLYGAIPASQDACDAIAVAHWTATVRAYCDREYISDRLRRFEDGITDSDLLFKMGRGEVWGFRGEVSARENDPPRDRRLAHRHLAESAERYEKALAAHRKDIGLPPFSQVKIDGSKRVGCPRPGRGNLTDEFDGISRLFKENFK